MAKANVIIPSNGADELGGASGNIHQLPDVEKNGSQEK